MKKKKRYIAIIGLITAAILGTIAIQVYSRYSDTQKDAANAQAVDFYFTSDLLSEEGKSYSLMPETTDLSIELRNYADALKWTSTDISYNYTVTKDGVQVTSGNGVIPHEELSSTTRTIKLTDLSAGTYEITAKTTEPFIETLTGSFTILEESTGVHYKIDDATNSPTAILTIWTDNYNGDVTVKHSDSAIPDSTQKEFENIIPTYPNGGTTPLHVRSYCSYSLRFFKTDNSLNFTNSDDIQMLVNNN